MVQDAHRDARFKDNPLVSSSVTCCTFTSLFHSRRAFGLPCVLGNSRVDMASRIGVALFAGCSNKSQQLHQHAQVLHQQSQDLQPSWPAALTSRLWKGNLNLPHILLVNADNVDCFAGGWSSLHSFLRRLSVGMLQWLKAGFTVSTEESSHHSHLLCWPVIKAHLLLDPQSFVI